jgi:hypothetical protein
MSSDKFSGFPSRPKTEVTSSSFKRQAILAGRSGKLYSDFLDGASGLSATLKANEETPLVVSMAAGFDKNGLPKDHIESISHDVAFSGLQANAINYLGFEKDTSGNLLPIKTPIEPIYGKVVGSDRENKIASSFNGLNGDKSFTGLYGETWKCYGVGTQISSSVQIFGNNTLRNNGAGYSVVTGVPNMAELDSWTIEFNYRYNNLGVSEHLLDGLSPYRINLIKGSDELIRIYLGDSLAWSNVNGGVMNGSTPLVNNTIYHLSFVFESRCTYCYINGAFQGCIDGSLDNYRVPSSGGFILGANYLGATPSTANFANFAFYPYAKHSNKTIVVGTSVFTAPSAAVTLDTPYSYRYVKSDQVMLATFDDPAFDNKTWFQDSYGRFIVLGNDANGSGKNSFIVNDAVNSKWGGRVCRIEGNERCLIEVTSLSPQPKWTLDGWMKLDDFAQSINPFISGTTGFTFDIKLYFAITTGRLTLHLSSNGTSWDIANGVLSATTSFSTNTYYFIEINFDGYNYRVFVNGSLEITVASSLQIFWPTSFKFGANTTANQWVPAWFNDLRFSPFARHTSAYSVPTSSPTPDPIYAYDAEKSVMYKGVPTTSFVKQPTIFVGEVETGASLVEKLISYSLNGRCAPIVFEGIPNDNAAFMSLIRHNIGVKDVKIRMRFKVGQPFANTYMNGHIFDVVVYENNSTASDGFCLPGTSCMDRNLFAHSVMSNTNGGSPPTKYLVVGYDGNPKPFTAGIHGEVLFYVERNW